MRIISTWALFPHVWGQMTQRDQNDHHLTSYCNILYHFCLPHLVQQAKAKHSYFNRNRKAETKTMDVNILTCMYSWTENKQTKMHK